jgi:CubicO group peptidase (beta-lactamase class C family)
MLRFFSSGILICALAVSCANIAPTPSSLTSPESVGMSSDRLARIAPVMRSEIDRGIMPGAVTLIARDGKIVHFEAQGFLDSAKTRPMTKDALFRGFSMTKPIVSVATMMLVEEGRLQLRDPISNWLPDLKDRRSMSRQRRRRQADAGDRTSAQPDYGARPVASHVRFCLRRQRFDQGDRGGIRQGRYRIKRQKRLIERGVLEEPRPDSAGRSSRHALGIRHLH